MATKRKTKKNVSHPKPLGWNTSDEQEIARRMNRAEQESFQISAEGGGDAVFTDWVVSREGGGSYKIELRSLYAAINSCDCKDSQVNGLGTCKHIEAVLLKLRKRTKRAIAHGSPFVEIFRDGRDGRVKVRFPEKMRKNVKIRILVSGFFDESHDLRGDPLQTMAALKDRLTQETSRVRRQLRISEHMQGWLHLLQQAADRRKARRRFEQDLKSGHASLDMTKLPLYPYQQEGMMHLAFTGRALLADEMGLGKTVQAIAACELLNRLHPLDRVLVISPASLKSEWLEQIGKFSHQKAQIIQGSRKKRYDLYRKPAFFYLANYEQFLYDNDFINNEFKPDLIILDEAQRIKNWQTKTAAAIKQLASPYAFVLTGTPLENRIDEIYSIAQFLDPALFGPLFRFNRDFHQLDEKGQAVGYKNLDCLHERLRHIMLRRRKEDVEGELPERSINQYFVSMTGEQLELYEEYERTVAQLGALAKKRPLKKKEREVLMLSLGCMRMTCDSAYILNQKKRRSPKLDELERLLDELLDDPGCKIIIFSEWERMLTLLAERLSKAGINYAWHTGSVTQKKRREEINWFKNDSDCRLFLATDSAATGLNLQIARVVVNLDLPWNPAKLEQRIARAWRKHQKHPVSVINLVSEHTIEHRMLDVLRHKTDLADAVVDGSGNVNEMTISAGRGSFMERLDELLGEPSRQKPPLEQLTDSIFSDHSDTLEHIEQRGDTLLVVTERTDEALADDIKQRICEHYPETESPPQLELLDTATFETLQRLAKAGIIQFTQAISGDVYNAKIDNNHEAREQMRRDDLIRNHLDKAAEKQRMSRLLADGGFNSEALVPLSESLNITLIAAAINANEKTDDPVTLSQIGLLQGIYKLPVEIVSIAAILRHERDGLSEDAVKENLASAFKVLDAIRGAMSINADESELA